MLKVSVSVDKEAYKELELRAPKSGTRVETRALADTGAQMCILGKEHLGMLGVELGELEPANLAINTTDGGTAANLGMVFLKLQAGKHESRQ